LAFFPELPITSPKKPRKFRFQIEDIGIIFQRLPSPKHGNLVFKQKILALFSRGSHHKPKKQRKSCFQIRRYWHYFPEFPITSPKKHGNPVFKKKILALFSKGSHHKPKKPRKFRFQIEDIGTIFQRLPSQTQKTTEIRFQIEDIA